MPLRIANTFQIASSGMLAEGARMDVSAQNLANANTVSTGQAEAWRRREVVLTAEDDGLSGVSISDILSDNESDFRHVWNPNHPYADENGFVTMSNVDIPTEMIQMTAASRAYQANVASMKRYQDMVESTLELLR